MSLLEKIADTLLAKNWIITLLSFVISVLVSVFVPAELFDKLPFDSKINVIVGFVAIAIVVFLVLYFFTWCVGKRSSRKNMKKRHSEIIEEEAEETVEQWRCFFDRIPDEEFSIIMYFMVTENKRPYKTWGYRCGRPDISIFSYSMEDQLFYILIYIPEEYEVFTSYTDGTINYDLHDYIKAYAAQKQVATQFVREKTIESDLHCQIMWALSLALYVKSGRTPWVVNGIQPDTAFAGIGYSVMNGPSGSNVVVGCSHIYSSDGRGMKYKLSKIQDYSFDRKKNPYLSEEEAYRIGLNIKELFYKSFSELPKRVVIHKRTPFRREEVKGLVESLSSAGVKNIELLEITYEDNLKCFALNERCTQVDGYPVRRGMCFPIDKNTMYLFTHGIAPSVISPKRRYFQGGKSVPLPLKVVKHYGSGDMAQIATEILGLSKMNWNSFGLYSKLPCTIESSNEIARIGWLLSQFEGTLYDYRYFM